MAILDTNFIIEYLWSVSSAVELMNRLKERGEILRITSINLYELIKGAESSPNSERDLERINNFIKYMDILYFNDETARIGGKMFAELRKKGKMVDDFDIMIGAIAIRLNETVVTKNVRHFERMKGIKIETY